MRKVDDGEKRRKKRKKKKKEKIMLFLVAPNIVAIRPPERRLTGTPHARAKMGSADVFTPPPIPSPAWNKVFNTRLVQSEAQVVQCEQTCTERNHSHH